MCEEGSEKCENVSGECENVKESYIEVALRYAADKLRGSVEQAEYKKVELGLIILKCASALA